MLEQWDLWFPSAGATGVSFARSRVEADAAGDRLLVHAAPPELEVTVRGEDGRVLAEGRGLKRGAPGPMRHPRRRRSRLVRPCRRSPLPVVRAGVTKRDAPLVRSLGCCSACRLVSRSP